MTVGQRRRRHDDLDGVALARGGHQQVLAEALVEAAQLRACPWS